MLQKIIILGRMYLSFILLTLAIVLLWLRGRGLCVYVEYAWLGMVVLALGVALYLGQLQWIGLVPILLFTCVCYVFARVSGRWRLPLALALVILSLGFGLHVYPGFQHLSIVNQVRLAPDSSAYSLNFKLDKPLVGLFILAWLHPLIRDRSELVTMFRQLLPVAVLTLGGVMLIAWGTGYFRLDMKLPAFLGYWLWGNLFFICVAEEALFRGFLQRQFTMLLVRVRYGAVVALVACAILFGIAHAAGGIAYVLLATFAGLGYGWAYLRTQRIEASILLHFVLNSTHIMLFSYPALLR